MGHKLKIINLKNFDENLFLEELNKVNLKLYYLELDISIENLDKLILEVLFFHKKYNIINFILNYDLNNINLKMSQVIFFMKKDIFKLVENYNLKIHFKGFTRCIFENELLRPALKNKNKFNLLFFDEVLKYDLSIKHVNCVGCNFFDNCYQLNEKYLNKFSYSEFSKMISNNNLYSKNLKKINNFENLELKKLSLEILEDFNLDTNFNLKRIVYTNTFFKNMRSNLNDRILYYIYKNDETFENDFSFIKNLINEDLIDKLKYFLKNSNQFGISFLVKNENIRKTIYFETYAFNDLEISNLEKLFDDKIILKNSWGLGIDFYCGEIFFKIYNTNKNISSKKILDFFNLENVGDYKIAQLMNLIDKKNLNEVLLDSKLNGGLEISKRVDISLQFNTIENSIFENLLNINPEFFTDNELYTISFEITTDLDEKINLYYMLK